VGDGGRAWRFLTLAAALAAVGLWLDDFLVLAAAVTAGAAGAWWLTNPSRDGIDPSG
jgi:hypothetical protein